MSFCACDDAILPGCSTFPFYRLYCTADKHEVEHSVEALSSAAFNMLVSQAVEQLKFDSVGRLSFLLQQGSGEFKS